MKMKLKSFFLKMFFFLISMSSILVDAKAVEVKLDERLIPLLNQLAPLLDPQGVFYKKNKIYDCFTFYNELELLKLRLDELNDYVDYFVLCESIETHRGNPKVLYFNENKHLFAPYLHKIIHVINDEEHPEMSIEQRENYQRKCIGRGLKNCSPDDIILISDLDEIPRHTIITEIRRNLLLNKAAIVSLQQDIYFFHLNRQTPTGETWGGGWWHGTVGVTYDLFSKHDAQYFRNRRFQGDIVLWKAGWHFTWMGGKEAARTKGVNVFEGRKEPITDEEYQAGLDSHPIVPLDDSFPQYVLRNQEYLRSIDFIAE